MESALTYTYNQMAREHFKYNVIRQYNFFVCCRRIYDKVNLS